MVLRPDEESLKSTREREERFEGNVKKGLKTAATIGTAAFAPALTAKIMPFLSEYIPTDLALKGISKVSPKIGEFLRKGQKMGLDVKEGLEFVKEQIQPKEETKEPPKENRNIIEQYSPELHQFISEQIKSGRKPLEAGAIAQHDKRFSDVIGKLSKDHKTNWSSILESVYGSQEQAQPQQNQHQQPQQQNQPGQGQQALMAILQKIDQKLGQ